MLTGRCATTTTFVLLACLQIALGQQAPADPTMLPTPTWRKNCFSDTESSNDCSANTIKIFAQYYTCDLAIETDNIPEEIAYLHGTILVAIGDETFFVRNEQLEPVVEKMSLPESWNDFTDNNNNRFYVNDKGILVTENKARSDIEISTTGEFTKHIFLDTDLNQLLILSYNSGDSAGSLFTLNTDSLKNAEDGKFKATKIENTGEDISAFAVESGTAKLLLGLRTEKGGGKIIRLSRQEGNPCAEFDVGKRAIIHIIEETKDKISKTLEEILIEKPSPQRNLFQVNEMELERKNKELTKQVLILQSRLDAFRRPILRASQQPGYYEAGYSAILKQPGVVTNQQEDLFNIIPYVVTRGRFAFECVMMNDFETIKTKFIEQEQTITELRQQLANTQRFQGYPNYFIPPTNQMHSFNYMLPISAASPTMT